MDKYEEAAEVICIQPNGMMVLPVRHVAEILREHFAYAVDQHSLICDLLGVSESPDDPGKTAFEAVVALLDCMADKIEEAQSDG